MINSTNNSFYSLLCWITGAAEDTGRSQHITVTMETCSPWGREAAPHLLSSGHGARHLCGKQNPVLPEQNVAV